MTSPTSYLIYNAKDSVNKLPIVNALLGSFRKHNISYCHWKSNEHLLAAIQGDTDLDLLFDLSQKDQVVKTLENSGFVKFKARWFLRYPHIEDYLGIDPETGKLVHIHVHYQLIVGKKRIKGYRLPWEKEILSARVWDDEHQIFRSEAAQELLLLLVRLALKIKPLYLLKDKQAFASKKETENALREFFWLKERVDYASLQEQTMALMGVNPGAKLSDLYYNGPTRKNLLAFRAEIAQALEGYKRLGRFKLLWTFLSRNIAYVSAILNIKLKLFTCPVRRTAEKEGMIVAILGADGSGKSTQNKTIQTILSTKLDVVPIYMGSGNGPASIFRKPLLWVKKFIEIVLHRKSNKKTKDKSKVPAFNSSQRTGALWAIWQIMWAISLAFEKKSKLKRAGRARNKGMMVVCDRYPQTNIYGYNDGPLLQRYADSSSLILRWLASWELKKFDFIRRVPPDVVIKLLGDPAVLHQRRTDMALQEIRKKQNGIKQITFPNSTLVKEIDATLPAKKVTIEIMNSVNNRFIRL